MVKLNYTKMSKQDLHSQKMKCLILKINNMEIIIGLLIVLILSFGYVIKMTIKLVKAIKK